MNRKIYIKDESVYFYNKLKVSNQFINIRRNANKNKGLGAVNDICPYCNKEIHVNDEIYSCISNGKVIPNKFVHVNCIDSKTDEELVEKTIELQNNYNDFLKKKSLWG